MILFYFFVLDSTFINLAPKVARSDPEYTRACPTIRISWKVSTDVW